MIDEPVLRLVRERPLPAAPTRRGERPGVYLKEWCDEQIFEECSHFDTVTDGVFKLCKDCGMACRTDQPIERSNPHGGYNPFPDTHEPCGTCERIAERKHQHAEVKPLWQHFICIHCGEAICPAHTMWTSAYEEGLPVCRACVRAKKLEGCMYGRTADKLNGNEW